LQTELQRGIAREARLQVRVDIEKQNSLFVIVIRRAGRQTTSILAAYTYENVLISTEANTLRLQQQLSRSLPPLNILRRALDLFQRVDVVNLNIQPVLLNEPPKLLRILQELLARGDVVKQRSAQQLDILRRQTPVTH
jgi:hypothetical protein